jgi:hypothetical protein
METGQDTALVVSVHQSGSGRAVRLNLRWQGKHDLGDFDHLDRLGTMTACDVETERTNWAVIEPRHPINPGDTVSLRQSST